MKVLTAYTNHNICQETLSINNDTLSIKSKLNCFLDENPNQEFLATPEMFLKQLRPLSRALLDKFLYLMRRWDYIAPAQETIADWFDAERTDICVLIGELEELGLISSHGYHRHEKTYKLSSIFLNIKFYRKIRKIITNLWGYTNKNKSPKPAPRAISYTTSTLLCNSFMFNSYEKFKKEPFSYENIISEHELANKMEESEFLALLEAVDAQEECAQKEKESNSEAPNPSFRMKTVLASGQEGNGVAVVEEGFSSMSNLMSQFMDHLKNYTKINNNNDDPFNLKKSSNENYNKEQAPRCIKKHLMFAELHFEDCFCFKKIPKDGGYTYIKKCDCQITDNDKRKFFEQKSLLKPI